MKAVVGLGNPGVKYDNTRHNIGFRVIDTIFKERQGDWTEPQIKRSKLGGQVIQTAYAKRRGEEDQETDFLIKPLTYMNHSGLGIQAALRDLEASISDFLVVCDDVNLPLGRIRLRASGSSGGHNGLQSIIDATGTEDFARLRIGIGRSPQAEDLSNFVLSEFRPDEHGACEAIIRTAMDAVLFWFERGTEAVMNEFNRVE